MIQACVIGLSKIGQIHCKNLIKIKKTQLSYIYDKNQKLCKNLSKKFKCRTSNNFNKILNQTNINLFVIASPTTTHEFYIKKLIKRKKIIYCEKPITGSHKTLSKIEKLIKKNNIKFGVGLNRRFSKEYISLKKKTKSKKIKIIQIISRSANHNVNLSVRNGGLFYDKGFHFFDLACWLGNSLPKKMIVISKSISTEEFLKKGDFSDAVINMRLRNNINVELVFSRMCRLGNIERIKIFGEKFILNTDDYSNKKTLNKDFAIRHKDSYFKCLNNFINSKKSFLLNEGINVQNICEQALKLANNN
tara:strand:+ start:360 stop:1271 length:912 start_codon:yes stop_codon:yes gene_type:complete